MNTGEIIDFFNNNDQSKIIKYINDNKSINLIHLLSLSIINNDEFIDIIDKCFKNNNQDLLSINYFLIIYNKSFDKLYELLKYIKINYKHIFLEIIKFYDNKLWFLAELFWFLEDKNIYKYWNLYKDINLYLKDKFNQITLFLILLKKNNIEIIKEYLELCPKIIYFPSNNLPLFNLVLDECKSKNDEISDNFIKKLKLLLDIDPDIINQIDSYNEHILLYPIQSNKHKLFEYLINLGADLNIIINKTICRSIFEHGLLSNNKKIHNILLKNIDKINCNYYNSNIETYPYIIFKNPNKYSEQLKIEIIKRCNILEKQTIERKSTLDLLDKKYLKFVNVANNKISFDSKLINFKDLNIPYSIFTPTLLDRCYYYYYLCNKYNNVGLSYIKDNKIVYKKKCLNNKCNFDKNEICLDDNDYKNCNLIDEMHVFLSNYPLLYNNNMLIWYDEIVYNIPNGLLDTIDKKEITVIDIYIGYNNLDGGHDNVIIINRDKNIAFRFEPGGYFLTDKMNKFDEMMTKEFKKKDIIYYSPNEYMDNLQFQNISGEGQNIYDNIGDPIGYCVAWSLWFIETYIENKNKIKDNNDLKKLVINISNKILLKYDKYLDYIREYGNYLKNNQIKFYKSIEIPKNRLYIKNYSRNEVNYIMKQINDKLT